MRLFKGIRCLLAGETEELVELRKERRKSSNERRRAEDRNKEVTGEMSVSVIKAWKEAGVDVDIGEEIAKLGRYG